MNEKDMEIQVNNFKQSLNQECYSFGWGRGIRIACNLYEDKIKMDQEILRNEEKLAAYKKEIDRLQEIITEGINEMTSDLLSTSLNNVSSAEIHADVNDNHINEA